MSRLAPVFRFFSKFTRENPNLANLLKSMPKEKVHIPAAQRQRKKIKEKYTKYSPGRVTLQVLGSGARGAPKSLYVFSDQARYLFNCGEGTQRLAHEHKMKLAKLEHIFITQSTWRNIGGIPGAALTIQDVGVPKVVLHGPSGLEEIFIRTERFVVIKDMDICISECSETSTFEDDVMKVNYVHLVKKSSDDKVSSSDNEVEDDDTDYYDYECTGRRQLQKRVASEKSNQLLKQTKETGLSVAYVCRLQPRPGALSLDSCVRFGVPPGPLLGQLKSGKDITLPNGTVVKSSDVCEPDDPGPVFIVVDCPSEDYLTSLVENETFKQHQSTATKDEDLAYLVVHFSPQSVIDHPLYKNWIEKFSPTTQHLILNESNTCMGSMAVHRIQHKLNLLSESIFPLLGDVGTQVKSQEDSSSEPQAKKLKHDDGVSAASSATMPVIEDLTVLSRSTSPSPLMINSSTLYNHHLRPRKGLDRSAELTLNPGEYLQEALQVENFPQVLKEAKQRLEEKLETMQIRPYPRVLFLGTGSSIPNKTRNTSGILIDVDHDCSIILDCGEGTYGQIVRFYGQSKCDEALSKIKAIYVSHMHADHHLGLIGLLQGRRQALRNLGLEQHPVLLFAPKPINRWLSFYDKYFERISNEFQLIPNSELYLDSHDCDLSMFGKIRMSDVSTCQVDHCPSAFGVCFTHENGQKIVYSGDTRPCENLVVLGKDCDLLIHEATMEDELEDQAKIKKHSTTSQAIDIGRRMGAKFTLLTHFSQRYAKLPRFNENFSENVVIAFDNMQVKLDELPLIHELYPALKLMFVEDYEELVNKSIKRQQKLEREKMNSS